MRIPTMNVPRAKDAITISRGANNYVTTIEETSKLDYLSYLGELDKYGFVKYADNGQGLDGAVFCSTYTRNELVLTVTHYDRQNRTSISFYEGPLSEHLIYRDSYVAGNKKGARSSLHMLELWRLGNSFVIQLKNGHFLISDGGMGADLPYLLDYLEELAPEGQKPFVEAWIISHAHVDHCGALTAFCEHTEWLNRIHVEGIYYSEPSERITNVCGGDFSCAQMKWEAKRLRTCSQQPTPFYRPQTGQRYYFNDITMDIVLTQEQVPDEDYYGDLNSSSTICLFTIEGQKCFFSGDIHQQGLQFIMDNYSQEYLNLDLFTLNHHGFNTSTEFADYAQIKTLLLTVQHDLPIRKLRETNYMISKVKETMVWGDGTKVLTFPYEIGSYKCLPCKEWIYNEGEERILQPNIYTFPGRRLDGFIFDADTVLFEEKLLKPGVLKLLRYLEKNEVHMSVFSKKTTQELLINLEGAEILDCFELVMGCDVLDSNDLYRDAVLKCEAQFQLDNLHKYVVICNGLEVVNSVIREGFRTIVVTDGLEADKELKLKCWEMIESLDNIYEIFTRRKVLFE